MIDLFNLREDFSQTILNESDALPDPFDMFEVWLNEAIGRMVKEPNAMNLATVGLDMKPSSRIVLLKQFRKEGFVFFTNYESKKAHQLEENPQCALNFIWLEMERQIRIEGHAEKISSQESDSYFEVSPVNSRLGAWASPQSEIIPDREYLNNLLSEYNRKFEGKEITRPENWGGYIVKPTLFEFWQGRSSRLHDRIQYRLSDSRWVINRLAP